MSIRVVHLNDAGIWVSAKDGHAPGNADGNPYISPGYGLIDPPRIEFGVHACAQSRLYPLNTYHQFWHRLDMEPFSRPVAHFRHNADIAFSHLQEIVRDTELDGDVMLLVPGSFSHQQLTILLGLARHCPFQVVGLADAGLAAAASMEQIPTQGLIYAELQLHQVVLTRLSWQGGEIVRDAVAAVPAAGRVQMMDSVLQLMTSAFVQQCRFNPQHNAHSEQFLFDCLPTWLDDEAARQGAEAEDDAHSGMISLVHNDTVHRARIARDSVRARLAPFYQKIEQQLQAFDPEQRSALLISAALRKLPGFREYLAASNRSGRREPGVVTVEAMASSALAHSGQLTGSADKVRFHTRLQLSRSASAAPAASENPSHLLSGHHAQPLRDNMAIRLGDTQAEIGFEAGHYLLRHAAAGVLVNGAEAGKRQRLQLGDSISVSGTDQHLQLIRVEDGSH